MSMLDDVIAAIKLVREPLLYYACSEYIDPEAMLAYRIDDPDVGFILLHPDQLGSLRAWTKGRYTLAPIEQRPAPKRGGLRL